MGLVGNFKGREMQDTMLVLSYQHFGYEFRLPLITYSQPENGWGLALTLSLAIAANAGAYALL